MKEPFSKKDPSLVRDYANGPLCKCGNAFVEYHMYTHFLRSHTGGGEVIKGGTDLCFWCVLKFLKIVQDMPFWIHAEDLHPKRDRMVIAMCEPVKEDEEPGWETDYDLEPDIFISHLRSK